MLRIGLILDSSTTSAWVARIIEDIQSSGFARLELVLLNPSARKPKSSFQTRVSNLRKFTLFRLYERWDYRRNQGADDAIRPTDVSSLLHGIVSIPVEPQRIDSAAGVPEHVLAEIRGHDLDVLFCFGFGVLCRSLPRAARFGVWSFDVDGSLQARSGAYLFRELFERNPISQSSLEMLTDSPVGRRVIYRSQAATDPTSLYLTRNPIYWKNAEAALRRLRDLDTHGMEYIQSHPVYGEPASAPPGTDRTPTGVEMVWFMARHLARGLQVRMASLESGSRMQWYLAIRPRAGARRFDDPSSYRLMLSPKDRFYADPFLIERDGKTFLFFEDFRYAEGRAVISCCELSPDGTAGPPIEVLRRPFHLSYPFLFEEEGVMYMLPESRENRTLDLYRATSFPATWIAEATLFRNVNVVDATIQKIDGKLWMFAGVSNGMYSSCDELGLFYADALRGPWTPHPSNPLVSDVERARPAGALFYDQGRLIRPSQDCSKAYGYALVFSEVITLSETEYKERPVGRLEPCLAQGHTGTHTYTRTERFEVVDRKLPPKYAR